MSTIKETIPSYDPVYTPSSMGKIVNCFRHFPGVIRSGHATVSFAAVSTYGRRIIDNHSLDFGLGKGSPFSRIYDLDGYVLLLGVPYTGTTSFHLAEYRLDLLEEISQGASVKEQGERVWNMFTDTDYSDRDLEAIGTEFEEEGYVTRVQRIDRISTLFSEKDS